MKGIMKPFTLEEYRNNPKRKIVTRDKGAFGMRTINEIKSIEITLEEDNVFKMDFNGYKEQEGYNLIIPKDNALRVARTLTRMANMIWEKYDIIANEKMGKEE